MTDLRLKYIKNSDSFMVLQPKKITNPAVGADFLEFYETLVTVMNYTEYPYNTNSGDGLFPAFTMIQLSDMDSSSIRTRAQPNITYSFDIQIDTTQYVFNLSGQNILTYKDLVDQLALQLPTADVTYLPSTVYREHQLTIASRTQPQTEQELQAEAENPSTIQLRRRSTVDINQFDITVLNQYGFDEKRTGTIPASVTLPLPRFGPEEILIRTDIDTQSEFMLVLSRGADRLSVPNDGSITNMKQLADYLNNTFNELRSSFLISYDPTVPTLVGEIGTVAMDTVSTIITESTVDGDIVSVNLNSPLSARTPTLVFGLLMYIPLPLASEFEFTTDDNTTKQRQKVLDAARVAMTAEGSGNTHHIAVLEMDVLSDKLLNKAYPIDPISNGLTLYDVLAYTRPTAELSWIELLTDAIKEKPRNPFPLFEAIGEFLSNLLNKVGGFIGAAIGKIVSAATIIRDTLKEGVDFVLSTIGNAAAAIASAAAELAVLTGQVVSAGAAKMLAAAKVVATNLVNNLVAAFNNPPDVSNLVEQARLKIDNPSVSGFDAPYVTVESELTKKPGEDVLDNPPPNITSESSGPKPIPVSFKSSSSTTLIDL